MKTLLAFAVFAAVLLTADPASAVSIVPDCARANSQDPASLRCAIETFENVARFIMGITGSLALLMFVYGGFTMLTANGVEDKVKKGKEIIRNAVIGIILIVSAFYIVDYFSAVLKGQEQHAVGEACLSGQGRYVETTSGNVECRYNCNAVEGYSCTSAPSASSSCTDYICPGTQTCCSN